MNMSNFSWGKKSRTFLATVRPELQIVCNRFIEITDVDATIIEGIRSFERQKILFAKGDSKTLNSRHVRGAAIDMCPYIDGKISWKWEDFDKIIPFWRKAAQDVGITCRFGYDWGWDAAHVELCRMKYPDI